MDEKEVKIVDSEPSEWEKNPNRFRFQGFVMERILGEKPSYMSDEEWMQKKIDFGIKFSENYGQKISDIITNDDRIRTTVMKGRDYYDSVVDEVIDRLGVKAAA